MPTTSERSIAEGSVERAFRVVQIVVASDEALGVREIGRRCGLPRSTASRLVGTLTRLGMVQRTPDGSVIGGSALETLRPGATPLLRDRFRPLLAELVSTFGENAALAVDDGDALLYLVQVNSENPVSVPDVSAERHEFHLVAPGLITMAWWDAARLDAYLAEPLRAATPFSVTDPTAIRRRLEVIRDEGFAWTDQELDVGVNGLAVPVHDADRTLTATISLYGPSYRFSPDQRGSAASDLVEVVSNTHHELGRQSL